MKSRYSFELLFWRIFDQTFCTFNLHRLFKFMSDNAESPEWLKTNAFFQLYCKVFLASLDHRQNVFKSFLIHFLQKINLQCYCYWKKKKKLRISWELLSYFLSFTQHCKSGRNSYLHLEKNERQKMGLNLGFKMTSSK